MMNRRLRERLTEAEILQIFVDVCEGVAFMHNSRPPLLHRDLKVENILQSSPTSYKLCDFGSATTVSRPPTNTQEIRALEADLGRHTTMQYRAPEMIDLYSKRPIDDKSDVWALGVLLYKLCYYTTPFEEHGSLAILNVQYRIPPYPVYSSQMNMLIGMTLFLVSGSHSDDIASINASRTRYSAASCVRSLEPRALLAGNQITIHLQRTYRTTSRTQTIHSQAFIRYFPSPEPLCCLTRRTQRLTKWALTYPPFDQRWSSSKRKGVGSDRPYAKRPAGQFARNWILFEAPESPNNLNGYTSQHCPRRFKQELQLAGQ